MNLTTPGGTHIDLLRETDGSYTAYELADASPYRVVRTTPDFQKQLTACRPGPPAEGSVPSLEPVQAFARTPSGGYLVVRRSDAFSTTGNASSVYVTEFDAQWNFLSEAQYPTSVAKTIALADLNGDGIPDIVIGRVSPSYTVSLEILLGIGGVDFQPPVDYAIPGPRRLESLAIGDLNGDHKLDVAVATDHLSIFFGNGDGTFQSEVIPSSLAAGTYSPYALAIADLNGDGKADLAFTMEDSHFIPYAMAALATGGGAFAAPVPYAAAGSHSIAVADMNDDGIPDLVTSGVSILFGDGAGAFPKRRDYFVETDGALILTDFDGDGKMDVVVASGNSDILSGAALAVLFGRGGGSFAGPPVSLVPGIPAPETSLTALAPGDFNHDGIPDLVSADSQGHIRVLKGIGDGSFRSVFQANAPAAGQVPSAILVADFNDDENIDFAVVGPDYTPSSSNSLSVFLGNGDGTFSPPLSIPVPSGALSFAAADFNGDDKLDLALLTGQETAASAGGVQILLGNGDGTFHSAASYPAGPFAQSVAAGDFNGDGLPDLAVTDTDTFLNQNRGGNVAILLGKDDGVFTFAPGQPLTGGDKRGPYSLAIADFNADGILDLAVTLSDYSNNHGGLVILLGRGDGTFQPPVPYASSATGVLTADLNGDGIPDLIVTGSVTSPGTGYLLGFGDGTFQPESFVADSVAPLAIADFNGDGKLDIAAGTPSGGIATFLNISQTPPAVSLVSAATFAPGPLAPNSLATAFGKNLATPFGTTVSVQDSTGAARTASLLYVSPRQVNFLVPSATAPGPATVSFTPLDGPPPQSVPGQIAPVAPALFSAGPIALAAAYAVLVSPGGAQTFEPVFTEQNGTAFPSPISLGAQSDNAYLILYGTGIRGAQSSVTVTIQGVPAPVTYSGPQPQFPGLDQINVQIPPTHAGSGLVSVALSASGIPANIVTIAIQ